jgi:ubiquitin carboxyl-terminal hydrolase 7
MFPTGNQPDCCSFYLEHGYPQAEIPPDWYSCVQFGLVLWNPRDPSHYVEHHAHHRFTEVEGDWGFTRFEELRKLFNAPRNGSGRPMVENDGANLTAYVRVVKDETGVLWHTFNNYDSKKETGFVGLRNQGATCYLNSLIQSLYFTNAFRKAVYQIPTENDATLSNSAYTLQRLFYQLQTSQTAVSTTELTKSFGWETRHIFEQQDVQELSRKLMERLEEKMKGTVAENVLPSLFCGKVKTYISCINVKYESSRVEDFWDIQLNVSGNKDIIASFQDYIQVEKMDGENQYYAGEEFKLQDANKGVIFQSFPDVLHLQLKRFEYDFERDAMMKINDRYEYPETFDAAPYLSEDSGTSEPYTYQLHGVLVHSGDLNAGHYYAFIKPTKDGHFYRYDDDRVTRATMREVLEENYGGYYQQANGLAKPGLQKPVIRQNSAYMLVYIRQSRLDKVLTPVTQDDVPIHLQKRLQEEAAIAEAQRKEREERHLYMNVRVVTEQTFKEYHGTDLASWDNPEKDPGAARTYRVLKASTVQDLVDEVANDLEKDPTHVRFWIMVNRQNKTTRPDQPITNVAQTMEQCVQSHSAKSSQEYRLWAEVAENIGEDGEPQWPALSNTQGNQAQPKGDNILLLLKWFDVEHQILRGIGHIYMGKERKVEDLVPPMLQKMGWPEKQPNGDKTQIQLYEEIKPQMVDVIKPKQSLRSAELQDGDIICFQKLMDHKSAAHESDKDPKTGKPLAGLVASITKGHHGSQSANGTARPMNWMEDAQQFYDYLLYRKVVHFMPHPRSSAEQAPPFDLELSIKYTYDQLAARVAEHLGCDPTHLRFHTVALVNGNPKTPLKRNINATLQSILNPPYNTFNTNNQRNNELYFEVLEMSLSELDMKKNLRVVWLTEGVTKEVGTSLLPQRILLTYMI